MSEYGLSNLGIKKPQNGANNSVASSVNTEKASAKTSQIFDFNSNNAELCKKFGLTEEQFKEILLKYPDFSKLSNTAKEEILSGINVKEQVNTENVNAENVEDDSKKEANKIVSPEVTNESDLIFDKVKYNKASRSEKINTLVLELTKNLYMYSDPKNPKTEEEWLNLSDEERNNLITQLKNKTKENGSKISSFMSNLSDSGTVSMVDSAMSAIQAASMAGMSITEYQKLPSETKEELLYSYLYFVDEDDRYNGRESSFSNSDREFWDRNSLLAESANFYFKQKGEDTNVCPGEVNRFLKDEGVSLEKIKFDYLQHKIDNNKELSDYEQAQYNYISEKNKNGFDPLGKAVTEENAQLSDPPSVYIELLENKDQEAFFENVVQSKKASIISSIVEKKFEVGSKEYYEQMVAAAHDAQIKGDAVLADELMQKAVSSNRQLAMEIDKDISATELQLKTRAASVVLDADEYAKQAENINNIENDELRVAAGKSMRQIASEDKMVALSAVKVQDTDVQKANVDMRNRAESKEVQLAVNKNIAETCNVEARKYAVKTTSKLDKDVQIEGLKQQLENAEPEIVKTAAEVPSTLHKDNQCESLKIVKNASKNLSKEDALEVELTLADQVEKAHKDNQLAMHEEIMKSEYSEVQERAAANIKNYDHSVQSKAIDVVYESGNSNAVKAVVENLEKMPPDIQKNEVSRLIGEIVLNGAVTEGNLNVKLMGGELTARDLSQLTASQRKEYFMKQFEEAPPAKKLEILMKMASSMNGIHQRTIYTVIARFSPSLLKGMVDRGMGKTMLEAGLPIDAVNKIIGIMKTSTNNEVIAQLQELRQDSSFAKYFADEKDNNKNRNVQRSDDLKMAFASPIDRPTYKKLKENNSTMYIKS